MNTPRILYALTAICMASAAADVIAHDLSLHGARGYHTHDRPSSCTLPPGGSRFSDKYIMIEYRCDHWFEYPDNYSDGTPVYNKRADGSPYYTGGKVIKRKPLPHNVFNVRGRL